MKSVLQWLHDFDKQGFKACLRRQGVLWVQGTAKAYSDGSRVQPVNLAGHVDSVITAGTVHWLTSSQLILAVAYAAYTLNPQLKTGQHGLLLASFFGMQFQPQVGCRG
jgi:hypothetical protein